MTKPGPVVTRNWRASVLLGIVATLLGTFLAYGVLSTSSAYVASLLFSQSVYIIGVVTVVSLGLLTVRRTRPVGVLGALAAIVMLVSFSSVYLAGYGLGLHAWKNDQPVPLRELDTR